MNILIVGFDNDIAGDARRRLIELVKSQNGWAKLNPNTYAITTPLSAEQFRDHIVSTAGDVDRLFVYTVNNRYWATSNMPAEVNNWLQSNWSQT